MSGMNGMNSRANLGVNFNFYFNDLNFGNMGNFNSKNTDNLNLRNFNFGNMEIDMLKFNNSGTTFNNEQASIFSPQSSHLDANMILSLNPSTNHSSPYPTSNTSMSNAGPTPLKSDSDMVHAHQPTKHKKVDEVNAAHILPKCLQCCQTKSVKAAAALTSSKE
jgi:hypothetical protein